MAGVASGLALATTLMAMQVADTMTARSTCTFRQEATAVVRHDNGFLGIKYHFEKGVAHVEGIIAGTPAEAIGLRPGDLVLAVDGNTIDSEGELTDVIYNARPGTTPTILVKRGEELMTKMPTLAARPAILY
jgi:S1-C subfamily serine protease